MEENDNWQQLEGMAAKLRERFPGAGEVAQSEKIWGRHTGMLRHVDVCIRTHIGGDELLVAGGFTAGKADRRSVEKLAAAKRDVGAHAGVLISGRGFSKAARELAGEEDIALYASSEVMQAGWSGALDVHALIEVWELEPQRAGFVLEGGLREEVKSAPGAKFTVAGTTEEWDIAMACENLWLSVGQDKRGGGSWAAGIGCKVTGRPEVKGLEIEVRSRLIRGLRRGRIHPVNSETTGRGWRMIFDGEMMELPNWKPAAALKRHPVVIENIQVRTGDPLQEERNRKIFTEVLEFRVSSDGVMTAA